METVDKVRIKKSEMEKWVSAEDKSQEAGPPIDHMVHDMLQFKCMDLHHPEELPEQLDRMELMNGELAVDPDAAKNAVAVDTLEEARESMKQFVDSVHGKASQVVTWIQMTEMINTDRSNKCLSDKKHIEIIFFSWPVV